MGTFVADATNYAWARTFQSSESLDKRSGHVEAMRWELKTLSVFVSIVVRFNPLNRGNAMGTQCQR